MQKAMDHGSGPEVLRTGKVEELGLASEIDYVLTPVRKRPEKLTRACLCPEASPKYV